MPSLTTLPKGDSAWLLRKSIERIMQQVSVLETNIGSSTTGNSSNTQVIFNDAGVLRGDADFTFNPALNKLSVNNIEVATTATISGNLTAGGNSVIGTGSVQNAAAGRGNLTIGGTTGAILNLSIGSADTGYIQHDATDVYFSNRIAAGSLFFQTNSTTRYRIASDGVATWSNVGGVAGTAMTLNANGLGVGTSPANDKILSLGSMGILLSGATSDFSFRNSGGTAIQRFRYTDATGTLTIGSATGTSFPVELGGNTTTRAVTIDASSNVGIGVTPSAWASIYKAVEFSNGSSIWGQTDIPQLSLQTNAFLNSSFQWIYKTTAAVSNYRQTAGTHLWFTAPSGTAGNVATLTQRMQLDVNGNLILLSSNTPATLSNNGELTVNATSNTNLRFSYRGSDGTTRVANITLA